MIKIVPSGDSIIIIQDLKNLKSSSLSRYIEKLNLTEIEDIISLKNSLGIIFNPYKITSERLIKKIQNVISDKNLNIKKKSKTWKIPICYDKDFAIDFKEISSTIERQSLESISLFYYFCIVVHNPWWHLRFV